MKYSWFFTTTFGFLAMLASPAMATILYNNLTPNDLIAMASRPGIGGTFEIETADDFVLTSPSTIDSASFTGLIASSPGSTPSINGVTVEIYRVFPQDSNTARTPNVVTRNNSPSDVALDSRDSTASGLTFGTLNLVTSFTATNSVQPGGIHPSPNQTTGGNGPITGDEVQFNVSFNMPFDLPAGHYFFVPQVAVDGGNFYWLSASRPISGPGTTPFTSDLQVWTRDAQLDPDWSRVGTDIVGGPTPPTFNAAFALNGAVVPEPATITLMGIGLAGMWAGRRRKFAGVSGGLGV